MIAGVDKCKGGWLIAYRHDDGKVTVEKVSVFAQVLEYGFNAIAVDSPIGLPTSERRLCDNEARKLLGPIRASSVFSAPIRPMLKAKTYEEANEIGQRLAGRKISIQCWSIIPQLVEVDEVLTPELQEKVFEVHPEVCFSAMNGNPVVEKKKEELGREIRCQLIRRNLLVDPTLYYAQLPTGASKDDLLDALASLWTAERYIKGIAKRIPLAEQRDGRGLRMEMWY